MIKQKGFHDSQGILFCTLVYILYICLFLLDAIACNNLQSPPAVRVSVLLFVWRCRERSIPLRRLPIVPCGGQGKLHTLRQVRLLSTQQSQRNSSGNLFSTQRLLYHRTCKRDFLCSWPSLNSYLNKGKFLRECCIHDTGTVLKNFPLF